MADDPHDLEDADYRRLLQFRTGLRRFLHWSEEQAEKVGLTPAQHQLLLAVRGHDDGQGPTIGDVAGYLMLRHHSAVGLIDRAVRAELVERREDPGDRRVVRLRLTAAGGRILQQLSALHLEEIRRLAPNVREIDRGLEP
jgi:DNA-binding MarR family transcriptional regulator